MIKYRAIIWGAGTMGQSYIPVSRTHNDILFFIDSNPQLVDSVCCGYTVKPPDTLSDQTLEYDKIIVAVANDRVFEDIRTSLLQKYNVPSHKIMNFKEGYLWSAHEDFIRKFVYLSDKFNLQGNMAELGVFQGLTASLLNDLMPSRKLYLFDTFQSFDSSDLERDYSRYGNGVLRDLNEFLKQTDIATVLSKMVHPESVVIKQGWFPSTFDLYEEQFCFVHIDFDLYAPTKAGLEEFYPRMIKKGVILVHDYFVLEGVTEAVDEFLAVTPSAIFAPIGDYLSLAIVKT